jgi:hypothetical protein
MRCELDDDIVSATGVGGVERKWWWTCQAEPVLWLIWVGDELGHVLFILHLQPLKLDLIIVSFPIPPRCPIVFDSICDCFEPMSLRVGALAKEVYESTSLSAAE